MAEGFGPKTEIISDLQIQPTAAYLPAAPSVPDEARQAALARAEAGEQITTAVAKEIMAETREKLPKRKTVEPAENLRLRLTRTMERFKAQWNPTELREFARQIREFADKAEPMEVLCPNCRSGFMERVGGKGEVVRYQCLNCGYSL